MATNLQGVFAGGDCATGAATVVEAVAAAAGAPTRSMRTRAEPDREEIAAAMVRRVPSFSPSAPRRPSARRAEMPVLDGQARIASSAARSHVGRDDNKGAFAEVELGFDDEVAQTEAERCLQCVCQAAGSCSLQKLCAGAYGAGVTSIRTGKPVEGGQGARVRALSPAPSFRLNREKCIRCMGCVRICERGPASQGLHDGRGWLSGARKRNLDFRDTDCNNCGQCVSVCPTGAIKNLTDNGVQPKAARKKTDSVCYFCGTGCAIEIETEGNRIVAVNGSAKSPANTGNLCVKGRFGMDSSSIPIVDQASDPARRQRDPARRGELGRGDRLRRPAVQRNQSRARPRHNRRLGLGARQQRGN